MLSRLLQSLNTPAPIYNNVEDNLTFFKLLQLANALSPILFTVSGILTSSISEFTNKPDGISSANSYFIL